MKTHRVIVCLAAVSLLAAATADDGDHAAFMHAMHESIARMDTTMAAPPMTGDPHHDFASMMIPHHEGIIGKGRAELRKGSGDAPHRMRSSVEPQSEIEAMQLWPHKGPTEKSRKEG
jgi:uncharacterized protein (DUF305 family)